ncbi:hypothetical protein [Streptomyces sp. RTd22]|uniref:hypothetical protein n=1 Tax=Streptomyces sp. RTd22 TaxID=1841249 RepID=UPI0007C47870|nr:hypothetical protein [Streptomyces sp. RTd22]
MKSSAFVYPWDVVGDPDAAARIADLGVQQVTLASAYHSTRALTPRHPEHRIVTARHAAVLYPPDAGRWAGRALRPYEQTWVAGADPFGEAGEALAGAGLEVHAWVVLAHNSRLGDEHPGTSVRNVYGDRYPWAPCIGRPEVREYLVDLAAEAAVRPGAAGVELESCGWYGLAHLHAHDKIGGVGLGEEAQYLMSLCFCECCCAGYEGLGASPEELRAAVRRALEPVWAGGAAPGVLGADVAGVFAAWRDGVASGLQRDAVAAVRAAAPGPGFQVLLHAVPSRRAVGANVGVDPADVLAHADGVVLPCTGDAAARSAVLPPFVPHRGEGTVLAANFTVVAGMGGRPSSLAEDAAHAVELGADEIRLYHAGLASDGDLAEVRKALGRLG